MRADLARLLDSVCRRVRRLELDLTLEDSIRATLVSDRIGEAETTCVRYAVTPSDALQGACLDLATWVNAREHRTGGRIETAYGLPQLELAGALSALLSDAVNGRDTTASVTKARDALARWGEA